MTVRAIILGCVVTCFICGYTFFNDFVMKQTMFVGNNMPISVYGLLVLLMLVVNPLLIKTRKGFSRKEIALFLAMALAACAIPGSNLMRLFTINANLPYRHADTQPAWQQYGMLDYAPDHLLTDVNEENKEQVVNSMISGMRQGDQNIGFGDVPWDAWVQPLLFWIPIVLTLWVSLLALSLILHRQWAYHEHLTYPIVAFTEAMLPKDKAHSSPIYRNKLFWIGALFVVFIHMYNFANTWFPEYLFGKLVLGVNLGPLTDLFPLLKKGGLDQLWGSESSYKLYFTPLALSYFLPGSIALSLGIGPYLYTFVNGMIITFGLTNLNWGGHDIMGIKQRNAMNAGAFMGFVMVLLYTGRTFYASVMLRALGINKGEKVSPVSAWACRVFIVGMIAFVFQLMMAGLDLPLAIFYSVLLLIFFIVLGRLTAEAGLIFTTIHTGPATVLLSVLGFKALGPEVMIIVMMLTLTMVFDTREAITPFFINILKLADDCKLKIGKTAGWVSIALILGMGVAVTSTLYYQYNYGTGFGIWNTEQSKAPFEDTLTQMQRLEAQGQLEVAGSKTGLERFSLANPHKPALIFMGLTGLLVLIFSFLRLRFSWWPFHPVMFLVWNSYSGICFATTFFVGWLIKSSITRFGGAKVYQQVKPLMIGILAGEVIGLIVATIISAVYYFITGDIPKTFSALPG